MNYKSILTSAFISIQHFIQRKWKTMKMLKMNSKTSEKEKSIVNISLDFLKNKSFP